MISNFILENISKIFIGDVEELFHRKTGPQLVKIFNENFGYNDVYSSGFQTRYIYVIEKFKGLIAKK